MQLQETAAQNGHQSQSVPERPAARMEKLGTLKRFFGLATKEQALRPQTRFDPRDAYSPLPTDDKDKLQTTQKTAYYGKVKSHYEGSQSQGNRFILNQDL